jgi:hypothetical protein
MRIDGSGVVADVRACHQVRNVLDVLRMAEQFCEQLA